MFSYTPLLQHNKTSGFRQRQHSLVGPYFPSEGLWVCLGVLVTVTQINCSYIVVSEQKTAVLRFPLLRIWGGPRGHDAIWGFCKEE